MRVVFIPSKANVYPRPLSISDSKVDRVCMTAAMLVLELISQLLTLPSEIHAYRAGRNAQQAAVEVEGAVALEAIRS